LNFLVDTKGREVSSRLAAGFGAGAGAGAATTTGATGATGAGLSTGTTLTGAVIVTDTGIDTDTGVGTEAGIVVAMDMMVGFGRVGTGVEGCEAIATALAESALCSRAALSEFCKAVMVEATLLLIRSGFSAAALMNALISVSNSVGRGWSGGEGGTIFFFQLSVLGWVNEIFLDRKCWIECARNAAKGMDVVLHIFRKKKR
jgi:hypothetical protein